MVDKEISYQPNPEEWQKLLLARHLRIKTERRSLLKTFIGLSGGAIILSATLIEKLAPQRVAVWLIVVAWICFAWTLLHSLLFLLVMTQRSMRYQHHLLDAIHDVTHTFLCASSLITTQPRRWTWTLLAAGYAEFIAGCLFLLGAIFLGIFSILNLLAK